jgi:dipeptidyl aminopeptidase/acylaminoacyl peptidase
MNASHSTLFRAAVVLSVVSGAALGQPSAPSGTGAPGAGAGGAPKAAPLDWKSLESSYLTNHVQLTSREQFVKAGEAYFSPDDQWIIFQAVAVPEAGKEADPFYGMYVAKVVRKNGTTGPITGIEKIKRISPDGSANTCGWFHPTMPSLVMYGSTIVRPKDEQKSGFQVGSRKYVWMFPEEMEVVEQQVFVVSGGVGGGSPQRGDAARSAEPKAAFTRPGYDAECSYDPSGRFLLYAHVEETKDNAKPDANIYVFDTKTGEQTPLVVAPGYDGGPFFSPDGKSICYRSDRKGNDLLQIYVSDLKFTKTSDGAMKPSGVEREYELTANEHVNWAPYFHPSGNFLVYGTSEVSHGNYEVFAIAVDRAAMKAAAKDAPEGTVVVKNLPHSRITQADGADVLPVFTHDAKQMMWTSQRGPKIAGEEKASSQLWVAEWSGGAMKSQ